MFRSIVQICGNIVRRLTGQFPAAVPLLIHNMNRKRAADKVMSLMNHMEEAERLMRIMRGEILSLKCILGDFEKGSVDEPETCDSSKNSSDNSKYTDAEIDVVPSSKRIKTDFQTEEGFVVVYADGACENNGKANAKAGIGVWFGDNNPHNVAEPVMGRATNNVAEIQACIAAVQVAKDNGIKMLRIKTDSQFCIDSMTKWLKGWKKRGWILANGKTPVKNKEDFQKLDNISSGIKIDWVHVSGHVGIHGNEMADQLAREGAKKYRTR